MAQRLDTYIRRAPGTHLWLALLLASTEVVHHVSPATAHRILELHSTNLHYLDHDPIRVLITSAWYLAGGSWLLYLALYRLFHVHAERWLGTARWLTVVLITHIGATYLSEAVLAHAIHLGLAPQSDRYTLDYGVSYGLAGVQAVLTYRITRPWRYAYAATLLLAYGISAAINRDFTSIGHLDAALLGFACYPITRAHRPLGSRHLVPRATQTLWRARRLSRSRAPATSSGSGRATAGRAPSTGSRCSAS